MMKAAHDVDVDDDYSDDDGWIVGYLCKQPPDNVWLRRPLLLHLFRVSFIVFSLQISFCICVIILATSLGVERAWHALLSLPRPTPALLLPSSHLVGNLV